MSEIDLSTARDTTGGRTTDERTIALRREFSEPTSRRSVGTFVVSRAGKAYDARGEFRALSHPDCLSRVSSDRTRVAVPLLDLLATSLPRANTAFARLSVLTPNNVGLCVGW